MHCLEVIIKRNQEAAEKETPSPKKPEHNSDCFAYAAAKNYLLNKTIVVWSTLIPLYDNDGKVVPDDTLQAIYDKVSQFFGGYTLDAMSQGVYISESGERFLDFHRRLTVACDDSKIKDARGLVKFIGHLLCQKTMPFFYNNTMELIS